jgi:hypothetical protein
MLEGKAHSKSIRLYQWLTLLVLVSLLFSLAANRALAQGNDPEEPRAVQVQKGGVQTGEAQTSSDVTPYAASAPTLSAGIATADPNGAHAVYAWPIVMNQMGHLIQSYQNYGSTAADAYFHHGIDIITNNYGVNVYAVSGGQVVNIQNYNSGNLYWEVAILDPQGYVWQYHHIDNTTIPQAIKDAYTAWKANHANGYIAPGTLIGKNVNWTVYTFGYYFHHIHLNILAAGDVYINPLEFLTLGNDTQTPEIQAIGLLKNNTVTSGTSVTGDYGLYVQTRDLYQSSVYYLPPYKYEFALDGGDWTTVWEFHTFPGGSNDYTFVNDFFVYPPTCGNYSCRSFYVDLGFTTSGERAFPSTPGSHTIQVRVSDYNGNTTTSSWSWTVQAGPVTVFSDNFTNDLGWTRNPSGTDTATNGLWERAVPQTTSSSGAKQIAASSASYDLVTKALAGSNANSNDIDGGLTSMRSPGIALPAGKTITLTLKYYLAHGSNSSSSDTLRLKVVGATTTTMLQELGAANNDNGSWATLTYTLTSYAGQTVYLLVEAADASSDSLVEAAVDDVVITAQ